MDATIARCVPSSCSPFWWSPWRSSRRPGPATRDGAGTCASIGCCARMPGVSSARSPSGRALRAVVGLGGWLQPMSATPSLTPLPLGVSAAGDARPGRSTIRCRGCGAASVSGASPSAMCFRAGERRPARAAVGDSFTEAPRARVTSGSEPPPAGRRDLSVSPAFWPPARSAGSERLAARVESSAPGLGPCRPAAQPLSLTAWVAMARPAGRVGRRDLEGQPACGADTRSVRPRRLEEQCPAGGGLEAGAAPGDDAAAGEQLDR